jgi:hypothetical protein
MLALQEPKARADEAGEVIALADNIRIQNAVPHGDRRGEHLPVIIRA